MNLARIAVGVLAVMSCAVATVAAGNPPGREFTGTAVVNGPQGTRSMPVTLVVHRFTPVTEVKQLGALLEQGGQGRLVAALRGRADGELRLGALTTAIALVAAEETAGGHRLLFLSPRRIQVNERQLGTESLDYPFGIAVIEIARFSGRGQGSLHVAAALSIDADGRIAINDHDGRDGRLRNLRRVR